MARRHRHTTELNVRTENYFHSRDLRREESKIVSLDEFNAYTRGFVNRFANFILADQIQAMRAIDEIDARLAKDEEKVIKQFYYELFDWKKHIVEAFIQGFIGRARAYIRQTVHNILARAYAEAYMRIKFEKAYSFRGYIVQFYFDELYNVVATEKPEVLNAIRDAVRMSNRIVRLIEEYAGEQKSMIHEFLSWFRKEKCHISAMLLRVTPLTFRILKDMHGNLYTAINMSAKHLEYNPYTRNVIPQPYYFTILNRRKGTERFSLKLDGGWTIIRLDSDIVTGVDFMDRKVAIRKLYEALFRPYVIIKDRTRAIGRPEMRFEVDHCSIYVKPSRSVKSRKLNRLDDKKRWLEKDKIYLRHAIV